MLTQVSPLLNCFSSALAGEVPRRSQIASTRSGWEDPENILAPLIAKLLHFAKIQYKSRSGRDCRVEASYYKESLMWDKALIQT